jgi:predicted ATPase
VLGLRAEREYPVAPLLLPADPAGVPVQELASAPAVALFVDRARAVRPDFALTRDNAWAVVELCRWLEGLPLAIELAAARTRLLDPDALLGRLARSLDALGSGAVDLPQRQHTLRATVAWSMGLLEDAERSLLETLATFVDGWTVEAAAQVAGPPAPRTRHRQPPGGRAATGAPGRGTGRRCGRRSTWGSRPVGRRSSRPAGRCCG